MLKLKPEVMVSAGLMAIALAIVASPLIGTYAQPTPPSPTKAGTYQMLAEPRGGDGVYILDTRTGELWHRTPNIITQLGHLPEDFTSDSPLGLPISGPILRMRKIEPQVEKTAGK